ncbi:MAG: penicillin-binding protein 2 [Phycisphaerales bacterium]|jgi:cell division protein FtsI/penicillin-binding protein 2|nr:penicillin-binding protein 2 [Phycisphaerales bacterium]
MGQNESAKKRVLVVSILATVFVTVMLSGGIYKVLDLSISPPKKLLIHSVPVNSTSRQLAKRGKILDRRGRVLAASMIGYTLFVDPSLTEDPENIALILGEFLDVTPAEIERLIRSKPKNKYVVIQKILSDKQYEIAKQLKIRAIGMEQTLVREYPHGDIGGALIGFVGTEHSGLAGIENEYNEPLTGDSGTFIRKRDSSRKTIWVSPEHFKPATNGEDIQLSIDVVIQDIATNRLSEEVKRCNAGGGRVIVANPSTGEILAMVDILNPRDGWSQQPTDPNRDINIRLGRNRCVTDPYEPGSTFKPFIWSIATELGIATIDEILPTPISQPHKTSFGRVIRDAHYYGPSSWKKVLVKSMNSGMAIVAERLSHAQLQDAVRKFGFGEKTHIGIGGETKGIVTSKSNWSDYTQTSVSMGHEIAVTPLQMVQGFSAFARDGTVPQLQFTVAKQDDVEIVRNAITKKTAALTRQIMGKVMTEGTGRKAQSKQYELFGKSGTAQLPKIDGKGYFEDRYIASFIAGAPLNNPEIVVLCVIDDPDKSIAHYGGIVAGPVVRDIIDETLNYLGVESSTDYLATVE